MMLRKERSPFALLRGTVIVLLLPLAFYGGWQLLSPFLATRPPEVRRVREVLRGTSESLVEQEREPSWEEVAVSSPEEIDRLPIEEREALKRSLEDLSEQRTPTVLQEEIPRQGERERTLRGGFACGNGRCEWPHEDCAYCSQDCGVCPEQYNARVASPPEDAHILFQGSLEGRGGWKAQGRVALLVLQQDRALILRFEDLKVPERPGLRVYLLRSVVADLDHGFLDLGELRGSQGMQNYLLPPNLDPRSYRSVLLYWLPFREAIASAQLE
jgi:hypothetical protein